MAKEKEPKKQTLVAEKVSASPMAEKIPASFTGYVELIETDAEGNEKGHPFTVGANTYRRTYERLPNFRVKKTLDSK